MQGIPDSFPNCSETRVRMAVSARAKSGVEVLRIPTIPRRDTDMITRIVPI